MKEKFLKFRDNAFLGFIKIVTHHKGWIFLLSIVFLIAFITGIMTCVHYLDIVTYENLINEYLINLLSKKSTYLTFFLMMLFWFLVLILTIVLFTKNIFFVITDIILFALMTYVWGFDICIIVMTLGLAGVVYGVLLLGILGVSLFFVIILAIAVVCKKFFITKNICDNETKSNYLKLFCLFILLGTAILFVMSFLFSSIHIFVIVD